MADVSPDHPKLQLLFFVAQGLNEAIRSDVKNFVAELATSREWLLGPPCFADSRDEEVDEPDGGPPLDAVGGYLEIYSAYPPWTLPREIEIKHLEEVTALLTALETFSRKRALDFEVAFDNEIIGYVESGAMDDGLAEVFLGEWRRGLGLSP
jgi:hypothetical protein